MVQDNKTLIVILGIAIVALACYYFSSDRKQEKFIPVTGGMQNLGSVEYDFIDSSYAGQDSQQLLAAPDFADMVDSSGKAVQAATATVKPLERLQALSDSYIPRIASKAIPFSQAAAKPLVHSFSVNVPRVNMKGRLYEMNLSEAVRGSVAINYDPNVAVVGKSRYGPSDAYNTGLFTPQYDSMYNKLSGSYRNIPMYTAGAGQAGGVGGNGIDLIMDG